MGRLPFHVAAADPPALFRRQDGKFQIVRDGTLGPLLTGPGYVLATEKLVAILESGGSHFEHRPAVIFEPASRLEIGGYRELHIADVVSPATVSTVGTAGGGLWTYANQYLFVSVELRDSLAREFPDLLFSEGFSRFAGA